MDEKLFVKGDQWCDKNGVVVTTRNPPTDNILTSSDNLRFIVKAAALGLPKIKPVVVGYKQVGYDGNAFGGEYHYSELEMRDVAQSDLKETGIKSKFRPIYIKQRG